MEVELQQLETKLRGSSWDAESAIQYLRLVREMKVRESEMVCRHGSKLLEKHKRVLSPDELWTVYEQVAIAAIDSCSTQLAASCINAIGAQFPDSLRTKRIQGMYYESVAEFEKAANLYNSILSTDANNEMALKRLVALEKSKGNLAAAIDVLRKYVDIYQNDSESWQELADLYLECAMYRQAAFCFEELITMNPMDMLLHLRYADTLYTLGGNNNLRIARAHYSKALEVSGGHSLRALYGICLCCANSTERVVLQDSKSRAQIELPGLTAEALIQLYGAEAPDKVSLVKSLLDSMKLEPQ